MTNPSPREALAEVLDGIRGSTAKAEIAKVAGISVKHTANAIRGLPVPTVVHLRLCAALGFDPLPEIPHSPVAPADFDFLTFAIALRVQRGLNRHNVRDAAEACGFSTFTVSVLENAHICGAGVVLKACRYLKRHPFDFFKNGEMFHVKREPNRLKSNEASRAATDPVTA